LIFSLSFFLFSFSYEDHDTDFVEHLRGEFAVAIWDEKRCRMVVARDRFGIKPVYYTTINGTFLVASEIKAFLALGWKPEWVIYKRLSYASLLSYLSSLIRMSTPSLTMALLLIHVLASKGFTK
jgi:asparagine synthetase B (glutamine-hydrolysing)